MSWLLTIIGVVQIFLGVLFIFSETPFIGILNVVVSVSVMASGLIYIAVAKALDQLEEIKKRLPTGDTFGDTFSGNNGKNGNL